MHQITVTIGRNVALDRRPQERSTFSTEHGQLTHYEWEAFKAAVESLVIEAGYDIVVSSDGIGEWEGVREHNYIVVGISEHALDETERSKLHVELAFLAGLHGQETIAVGEGYSKLIEADYPEPKGV